MQLVQRPTKKNIDENWVKKSEFFPDSKYTQAFHFQCLWCELNNEWAEKWRTNSWNIHELRFSGI